MSSINNTSGKGPVRSPFDATLRSGLQTSPLIDPLFTPRLATDKLALSEDAAGRCSIASAPPTDEPSKAAEHAKSDEHAEGGHNLHGDLHSAHTKVDAARLAHSAPEVAGELAHLATKIPGINAEILTKLAELGEHSPTITKALIQAMEHAPQLVNSIAEAIPLVGKTLDKVGGALLKEFPKVPKTALIAAAEKSVLKHLGTVLPIAGLGIAAYGTYETAKVLVDPHKSSETKKAFMAANAMDWGAAIAGTGAIGTGGLTEALSIGAAAASMGLYARAEVLSERDAELVKEGKPLPTPPPAPAMDPMLFYGI